MKGFYRIRPGVIINLDNVTNIAHYEQNDGSYRVGVSFVDGSSSYTITKEEYNELEDYLFKDDNTPLVRVLRELYELLRFRLH